MTVDPVCGMTVEEKESAQTSEYNNEIYFFCSAGCRKNFEKEPDRYIGKSEDILKRKVRIAYFSMEIGLDKDMPTYSGGLGVLAGDTIRAAADLEVSMAAVSLLYRKGYFYQKLDESGWQTEEPVAWIVTDLLRELPERVSVSIEERTVFVRAWLYKVEGASGWSIPVYFLDTDLPENSEWDRTLTHSLYGGDVYYRLCQEVVLGIGGIRMLRQLGHDCVERFHMNEGHSALLTMELLREEASRKKEERVTIEDVDMVRKKCIFTTHTPVPSGHDQFPLDMADKVLIKSHLHDLPDLFLYEGLLNMTHLALNLSRYVNGVAKRHGEISRMMFAGYAIDAITNGIHAASWTAEPFRDLFNRHISGWMKDNFNLRYALGIPPEEIWKAHMEAKKELIHYVNHEYNAGMGDTVFTIGFARRAATYKRGDLIFQNMERLRNISREKGPLQIIFAGKAHPRDEGGKEIIKKIFQAGESLQPDVKIAYLSDYDLDMSKMMTAGSDLWLNTPQPPLEASGTSGMKAAVNGVPSFSIQDGWWVEGCIEGLTGWAIGKDDGSAAVKGDRFRDSDLLYEKLENVILPLFYQEREHYIQIMLHTIALNGSFFNTHRMMQQYVLNAYFR